MMKKTRPFILAALLILWAHESQRLSAQTSVVNSPPSVAITNPVYGATFASSASIPVDVDATDADGSINRVELFVDDTKVSETFRLPFRFTLPVLTVGNHTITALATDNSGALASSRAVPITVFSSGTTVTNIVQFGNTAYTVNESSQTVTISVTRLGFVIDEARVDYATFDTRNLSRCDTSDSTANGIASQKCDYTPVEGTLRFAPGEREKTFTISLNDDNYQEGPETFRVALSNAVNTTLDPLLNVATITITDNDTSIPTINPVSDTSFFVRRQYLDFLSREPDAPGQIFWNGEIANCKTDTLCLDRKRVNTSAAFFLSTEFQTTGYFIYRLYKGSLGRVPSYTEFVSDLPQLINGIVVNAQLQPDVIAANKLAFANAFLNRPEFRRRYDALAIDQYIDQLFTLTNVTPTLQERNALLLGFNLGTDTRASILLKIVDGTQIGANGTVQFTNRYGKAFYDKEFNPAFVLMQYFGYLRRNPDTAGYNFWLDKLNKATSFINAEMVRSFILSDEYLSRFGPQR